MAHLHRTACWIPAKPLLILQVLVWDSCHSCASKAAGWPLKIKLLSCFLDQKLQRWPFLSKPNDFTFWSWGDLTFRHVLLCQQGPLAAIKIIQLSWGRWLIYSPVIHFVRWASKYRSRWFINCKVAQIWYCAFDNSNTLSNALLKAA